MERLVGRLYDKTLLYLGRSASTDMGPCIRNGVGPDAADNTRNALQRPKRRDFVIEIPHGPTGDNIATATDYYPRKRRASGTVSAL